MLIFKKLFACGHFKCLFALGLDFSRINSLLNEGLRWGDRIYIEFLLENGLKKIAVGVGLIAFCVLNGWYIVVYGKLVFDLRFLWCVNYERIERWFFLLSEKVLLKALELIFERFSGLWVCWSDGWIWLFNLRLEVFVFAWVLWAGVERKKVKGFGGSLLGLIVRGFEQIGKPVVVMSFGSDGLIIQHWGMK